MVFSRHLLRRPETRVTKRALGRESAARTYQSARVPPRYARTCGVVLSVVAPPVSRCACAPALSDSDVATRPAAVTRFELGEKRFVARLGVHARLPREGPGAPGA